MSFVIVCFHGFDSSSSGVLSATDFQTLLQCSPAASATDAASVNTKKSPEDQKEFGISEQEFIEICKSNPSLLYLAQQFATVSPKPVVCAVLM